MLLLFHRRDKNLCLSSSIIILSEPKVLERSQGTSKCRDKAENDSNTDSSDDDEEDHDDNDGGDNDYDYD